MYMLKENLLMLTRRHGVDLHWSSSYLYTPNKIEEFLSSLIQNLTWSYLGGRRELDLNRRIFKFLNSKLNLELFKR